MIQKWLECISDYGLMWFLISYSKLLCSHQNCWSSNCSQAFLVFCISAGTGQQSTSELHREKKKHTHTKISLCNFARQ